MESEDFLGFRLRLLTPAVLKNRLQLLTPAFLKTRLRLQQFKKNNSDSSWKHATPPTPTPQPWLLLEALKSYDSAVVIDMKTHKKLDVDPHRDDDASPMSSYRCMSLSQVKIRISIFFGKFFNFFAFPCCSSREDLSIYILIINVGLILTKLRWFQLFSTSQNSNFKIFWKKKTNFWVSMV